MRIPKLCHHRPTDQAYVRFSRDGKRRTIYLGKWGQPETEAAYNKLCVELMQGNHYDNRNSSRNGNSRNGPTVAHLAELYLPWAEDYYSDGEMPGQRAMVKWAKKVAGTVPLDTITPKWLKRIRDAMVEADCSRGYVNQQAKRFIGMLKWGVEEGHVDVRIVETLKCVKPLRPGQARETDEVKPVPDEHVLAALELMPDVLADMVQLQLLLACRPGELWIMRPQDIERGDGVWLYVPATHKTAYKNKSRIIRIGPMAQDLLRPYLLRPSAALCFRSLTDRPWNRFSYREAIHDACRAAGVPCWNPYQLRHNAGTEIRQRFGLDGTQKALGHASIRSSEIYGEVTDELGEEIARHIG